MPPKTAPATKSKKGKEPVDPKPKTKPKPKAKVKKETKKDKPLPLIASKKTINKIKRRQSASKDKNEEVDETIVHESSLDNNSNEHDIFVSTQQCGPFKTCMETLNSIFGTANFRFSEENITVIEYNDTDGIFVYVNMRGNDIGFYHYSKEKYGDTKHLSIKLDRFYSTITTLSTKHVFSMYYNSDDPENIHTVINQPNEKTLIRDTHQLVNTNLLQKNPIDAEKYPVIIRLPSSAFQRVCRDALKCGNNIMFQSKKGYLVLNITGNRHKSREIEIVEDPKHLNFIKSDIKDDDIISAGTFNLQVIVKLNKCTSISEYVKLYMSNELPLMLEYDIGNIGFIRFFIKRIEER